jgi:Arc/MetJ-type ribon-helix-helix transcriptional regulator
MTLRISITPQLQEFTNRNSQSSRFESASDMSPRAFKFRELPEREREAHYSWLQNEIEKGIDSGPPEPISDDFWSELQADLRSSDS